MSCCKYFFFKLHQLEASWVSAPPPLKILCPSGPCSRVVKNNLKWMNSKCLIFFNVWCGTFGGGVLMFFFLFCIKTFLWFNSIQKSSKSKDSTFSFFFFFNQKSFLGGNFLPNCCLNIGPKVWVGIYCLPGIISPDFAAPSFWLTGR